jgi:hypothetical protein
VFRQSERTLTAAESERLVERSRELTVRVEQLRRESRSLRIRVTLYMLGITAFFATVAVVNLVLGHGGVWAAIAALAIAVFGGWTVIVSRPIEAALCERKELASIEAALSTNKVFVHEIEADAALVLEDDSAFDSGTFGYVLRTDTDEYVYVHRYHCQRIDPEQLPSTRLVIEVAMPLGLLAAEARGSRIAATQRIGPIDRVYVEQELHCELVALTRSWPELVERLSAMARAPTQEPA